MIASPSEWDGADRRQNDRDELVQAVVSAIRDASLASGISPDEHREQHAFLHEWIEEIKRKRERHEKIKTQVIGWGLIALLGAIGSWANGAFTYLREHLK